MGDFKKNLKKPFGVSVPNKIRKRIAMHREFEFKIPNIIKERIAIHEKMDSLLMPLVVASHQRGSMWTRFTNRVKKFLK